MFHPDFVSTENSSDAIHCEFYELEIYKKNDNLFTQNQGIEQSTMCLFQFDRRSNLPGHHSLEIL